MDYLTPKQSADYQQFWPRLEAAVRTVIGSKELPPDGRPAGRPLEMHGYLNHKTRKGRSCPPGLGDRVAKAKRDLHRLKDSDYQFIKDEILEKAGTGPNACLSKQTLQELEASFQAYVLIGEKRGAKTSSYWAPTFLTDQNANARFDELFDGESPTRFIMDQLVFRSLLATKVDAPAYEGQHGTAITNARVICKYLKTNQEDICRLMGDQVFAAYRSMTARYGAWAAQQVGAWGRFNEFMNITAAYAKTGEPVSVVANGMLSFHLYHKEYFGSPQKYGSRYARKAYRAYKSYNAGSTKVLLDDDSPLLHNPVWELIYEGHGASFKNEDTDFLSIEDRLLFNRERSGASYSRYEEIGDLVALGTAYLNEGNIYKANAVVFRRANLGLAQSWCRGNLKSLDGV